LINRFIKKEESLIYKAEKLIEIANMIQIDEESKLPTDIIKLAASESVELPSTDSPSATTHQLKRKEEQE